MATAHHLRPFLLPTEPLEPVTVASTDLYLPDRPGPHPLVVLVHGGPVAADAPPPARWQVFRGYAGQLAARGVVAAVPQLPMDGLDLLLGECATVLRDAVRRARRHPAVDADRVAIWFFSDAGLLMGEWLDDRPRWLRAVAATYPRLRLERQDVWAPVAAADVLGTAADLPVLVTRVGLERPEPAASVAEFLEAARDTSVEVLEVPGAVHGFDLEPPTAVTTQAVATALEWVVHRVRAEDAVPYQRLAAYALLRRDDEVLLTRISTRGHHAGEWTLPGGGVEHGEQVRDALRREVHEETGLEIEVGALRDVHSVHFTGRSPSGRLEDFHGVHLIFDATVVSAQLDPRVVETDGSTDAVAWFDLDAIERGVVRVLDVVRHAMRGLG